MRKNKRCHGDFIMDEKTERNHNRARIFGGIFVILAGLVVMLHQLGFAIPFWLLQWEWILIGIGIASLIKHNFKKTFGFVLIVIGSVFLLNDIMPNVIEPRFIWPVLIMFIGVSMVFKTVFQKKNASMKSTNTTFDNIPGEDYVQSSAFFSGITKKVVSKNFKGASITSVFGGNEINLTQADFTGEATVNVSTAFGGVTLIVPSNWKVKSDVTSIFGGIDDQRPAMMNEMIGEDKTLILKGTCVFGGIEIHSYN